MSKKGHSPECATVGTGQKEPRNSRQVFKDIQHEQGHVLGGVRGQPPGQKHPEAGAYLCPNLVHSQRPVQTGFTAGT